MGFQSMAELADCGLIGGRLPTQIDVDKLAHRARVIQRLFHRRVGQVEPMLQKVNAQHPLQPCRRAARAFAARVYRLDQRRELLPRHHPVHLRQKLLAAGGLAVTLKAGCGERFLLRARHPTSHTDLMLHFNLQRANKSECP